MNELKLSVAEWHLLSIAYQQMVKNEPEDTATQHNREVLAERVKAFTNQVYDANKPVIVQIDREK